MRRPDACPEWLRILNLQPHPGPEHKSQPLRWDVAEIRSLLAMREDGDSFAEIARALGRTMRSCENKYLKIQEGNYEA